MRLQKMSRKKKVLVIDDNDDVLRLVEDTLGKSAYECITAQSAIEGLEKAAQEMPQLILLDLMLPKMSGLGFMREIKSHPELKKIPVVAFTTLGDEDIANEVMALGAVGFLRKACGSHELISMIDNYAA